MWPGNVLVEDQWFYAHATGPDSHTDTLVAVVASVAGCVSSGYAGGGGGSKTCFSASGYDRLCGYGIGAGGGGRLGRSELVHYG